MSKLVEDVLFLILEELKKDNQSLFSCLLVNKSWCETTVPIIWNNPNQYCKSSVLFFNTILLHLSEESKNNLKNHGIELFMGIYKRPLFHYIYFWNHLNLRFMEYFFYSMKSIKNIENSKRNIIWNEILNLLINKNTSYTHLYIHPELNYQLHQIPGVENCFSRLQYVSCSDNTESNILEGLADICKSIKKLRLDIIMTGKNNNHGIIKLIEAQNNLNEVYFDRCRNDKSNETYRKTIEESIIKSASTIQHLIIKWKPITNILLHLVNLISLNIDLSCGYPLNYIVDLNLEKVSLPFLKILRTQKVPSKNLASFIENVEGNLTEINVRDGGLDNERFIKAICKNCPKLEYLKLLIKKDISELGKLLISCKFLKGLYILTDVLDDSNWDELFDVLIQFSPINLFKFKFSSVQKLKLESLKFFLDNWEERYSMLLQIISKEHIYMRSQERQQRQQLQQKLISLLESYKIKGIIKKYDLDRKFYGDFEDFEWIEKKYP
jgi:hypothetical protein